ncbi:unnamed protein product [Ostreobium quekettii]|uniref:RRM domain-containing protein n=1 Tax=Ostreobium quekettii TaxID=121088 RepID=A0A8S1J619_9CHLO|nr:unnamed protein product [Ostreobium quekettii]
MDKGSQSTLYVGNLHPFVTENMLQEIFTYAGVVEQVKIVRDKTTGASAGYGFVKYYEPRSAQVALQTLTSKVIYDREVRLNWAFQSSQREDTSKHFHMFVGDLSQDVTDAALFAAFSGVGTNSCSDARVMWDHSTGRSKGYGFVSFRSREDAERAIQEMHGQLIGSRRVRCGWAQHKQQDTSQPLDYDTLDKADPTNTNVYIGNIPAEMTDTDIRRHFQQFGPVVDVKLHKKGGYGFVRFQKHSDAVNAILQTRGKTVQGKDACWKVMKCHWGKHPDSHADATSTRIMLPGLNPMSGVLGSGDAVIQGLLPTAQYMLPTPMTSQQIMMANQFMGQGPMSPGGMSGMGVRTRVPNRVGGVSAPLGGQPGGYYPGMYYSS